MKNCKTLPLKQGEYWFSGVVDDTIRMPYTEKSEVFIDPFHDILVNQINPVLVSSQGRFFYAPDYFTYRFSGGTLTVCSDGEILYGEQPDFKTACEYLRQNFYPQQSGKLSLETATMPQYCTWMALGYDQTQEGVIAFAESILQAGLPAGVLIIDDGWANYYGDWTFVKHKFPNPKQMFSRLHELGFCAALWVCPYVSPDSAVFRFLRSKDYLLKRGGKPFLAEWWDGYSACIDFTNPAAKGWFLERMNDLTALGADGLKLDGGDRYIYDNDVDCFEKPCADGLFLSEAYAKLALEFSFSELRGAAKTAGAPVFQRIADRTHAWEDSRGGLDGIVKKSLIMSIFGYPFNAPDMVGGGLMADWGVCEDEELNIRYMQAATFMPAVQFSKTLWRYGGETEKAVKAGLALRAKYADLFKTAWENSIKTGKPIIAPLLWTNGEQPAEWNEFLLGEKLLVAPVLEKGQTERKVYLPNGVWRYAPTGEKYEGEQCVSVPAPLSVLPYFEKI